MELDKALGIRSAFNFSPERYTVDSSLVDELSTQGFEVALHGLRHDGLLYATRWVFRRRAERIRRKLHEWEAVGFCSPSSHHRLTWLHELPIEYDSSTFDADPFEPENDGIGRITPLLMRDGNGCHSYVELPYTLPQDFTLFVLLQQTDIRLWLRKLDWIAERGGLALLVVHPDYLQFGEENDPTYGYPVERYTELVSYLQNRYAGQYWQALPREVARYWRGRCEPQG
jgi:hypothetical protein